VVKDRILKSLERPQLSAPKLRWVKWGRLSLPLCHLGASVTEHPSLGIQFNRRSQLAVVMHNERLRYWLATLIFSTKLCNSFASASPMTMTCRFCSSHAATLNPLRLSTFPCLVTSATGSEIV
jgi:hypothetical protein